MRFNLFMPGLYGIKAKRSLSMSSAEMLISGIFGLGTVLEVEMYASYVGHAMTNDLQRLQLRCV